MLYELFTAASPALCCQAFLIGAAAAVPAMLALPNHLRAALMDYGPRRSAVDGSRRGPLALVVDLVRRPTEVPHSWYWHFYLVSLSWSVFWAWQYLSRGSLMDAMARAQLQAEPASTPLGRVFLTCAMMALQGGRRLYECLRVIRPGATPVPLFHWALGLVYYTVLGVAAWIHGSGAIIASWTSRESPVLLSSRVPPVLVLFFVAWYAQYQYHAHLASLKKYTLPTEGLFAHIVCPHYTCECVIYLAIALMAAPAGRVFNTTELCGVVFAATNLSATAYGTKQWYAQKFGAERVVGRWCIIPWVL